LWNPAAKILQESRFFNRQQLGILGCHRNSQGIIHGGINRIKQNSCKFSQIMKGMLWKREIS
jgi:hypothetical protein